MASRIFNLPIAAVSLTDVDRQWFKSRVGVKHQTIPRDSAPCARVAERADMLVIHDMAADNCFRDSVLGKSGIRFYAGAPLVTREGYGLGALCVLGTEPRQATEEELASLTDLAAMVMAQIELQHAFGRIEPVSGLPNRIQFLDDVSDAGRDEAGGVERFAVLVDLADARQIDHLSRVMGPGLVEKSVKEVARLLRSKLGRKQTAYHVSPTQFAFIAHAPARKDEVIESLEETLQDIHVSQDLRHMMTPVIGVVPFIPGAFRAIDLLTAMSGAVQDARSSDTPVCLFSPISDDRHRRSFRLLTDFDAALLAEDQLSLVYQPRIALSNRQCVATEVLLRWSHPDLGNVSPGEFISIIEDTPHVREMTAWVLDHALRQASDWRASGLLVPMSVNISAVNLAEDDFVERVTLALARHEIEPAMLELEVTESAIMRDPDSALLKLEALANIGITLSIDDFGTGYSSLSYLQKLPTTVVKIDQSFVRGLSTDERGRSLVQSMITLSHDLGYRVVAEGVESVDVMDMLTDMGCEEAQGYLFAKPLTAQQFADWTSQTSDYAV